MTSKPKKKGEEYIVTYTFPTGAARTLIKSENMYRDYTTETDCLESFPGYRRLLSLGQKINGIYPERRGDSKHYLVHAGATLFRCSFDSEFLDSMTSEVLCDMADHKSSSYRHDDCVYIFDSNDITVICEDGTAKKVSENEDLPYVPTTFINGEEYEQQNLLTDAFKEELTITALDEIAYESDGLYFSITSETNMTCALTACAKNISGRVDIPSRKYIDGKYYRVTEIAPQVFREKTNITLVYIGPYVKKIGDEAFLGCTSLALAVMGEGTQEIGKNAFAGCTSLSKIYLCGNLRTISESAFYECDLLTLVYFSGTEMTIGEIEGIESLVLKDIKYKEKFKEKYLGLPVFTPCRKIKKVTAKGSSVAYTDESERGFLKVNFDDGTDLLGTKILIEGNADTTTAASSKRRTPYTAAFSEIAYGDEAIYSCSATAIHDGRYCIFASDVLKNLIFQSSYTKDGVTHPLYFGALDYIPLGSSDSTVTSMIPLGSRIAITKRNEESEGKIYIMRPDGEQNSLYGRTLSLKHTYDAGRNLTDVLDFDGGIIFLCERGIMRLTTSSDLTPVKVECISENLTCELDRKAFKTAYLSRLCGYVALFCGGDLYLLDKRQSYKSPSGDTQYFCYKISDVHSHIGEAPAYYYSSTAASGCYIHPNEGELAEGTVYSFLDEEGKMQYYVKNGILKYSVVPSDELFGGEGGAITASCEREMSLIFGTEDGDVFAFNTDKRGVPPRAIYEGEGYDEESYKNAFGKVYHPFHYSAAGHRMRFSIVTPSDDCGLPNFRKSTKRGSMAIILERRSNGTVKIEAITDKNDYFSLTEFPLGDIDFSSLDFDKIGLTLQNSENHMIPEKCRNYIEKQIIIYINDYLSPFAIRSLSYTFKINGKIKNR